MDSNSMNLINAGNQLANIAQNLAQRAGHPLSPADAALLDAARAKWDEARRAAPALASLTDEQINYIGEQWDGCIYDAGSSGNIDIGAAVRAELKKMQATPVVHNPQTGTPRDPRDIASDPRAALCVRPGEPLRAAARPAVVLSDEQIDAIATETHPEGRCTAGSLRRLAHAVLAAAGNSQGQAAQPEQQPVGEVVLFGKDCKEISWAKGKMPPVGAKLYTAPVPAAAPEPMQGWKWVPVEPTEAQWSGLARDLIFAFRASWKADEVLKFLSSIRDEPLPQWLLDALPNASNHTISKGTCAALVYKAMLAAAPVGGKDE